MANKKKDQRHSRPQPAKSPAPQRPQPQLATHVEALRAEATPEDRAAAATASPAADADLALAARQIGEAHALLRARERSVAEREAALARGEATLADGKTALDAERQRVEDRSRELERLAAEQRARERELDARDVALLNEQKKLAEREAAAAAGFARELRAALADHEAHARGLRDELAAQQQRLLAARTEADELRRTALRELEATLAARTDEHEATLRVRQEQVDREIDARRQAVDRALSDARAAHDRALHEERAALATARRELDDAETALREGQRRLEIDRELFAEEREDMQLRIDARSAAAVENLTFERDTARAALAEAQARRDDLYARVTAREDADRRAGHRPLEEVLEELDRLRSEREQLQRNLAERPDADLVRRHAELDRQRSEWNQERAALLQQLADARLRLARSDIAVWEIETLRDQKATLERSRSALQHLNEQLRKDIDDRIKRNDGREVFPAFLKIDRDGELEAEEPNMIEEVDLRGFVEDLQHRIASAGLYYDDRDLRCLVAGLAASKLHILQGISGTGKTSLPLAFARAIGAGSALIAVQAGWRDRQDLIGHFNAFDTVFHESEFLQALYKAQSPRFRDRPFIVVLDEMNLSHPEQYFADFLSMIEKPPEDRRLLDLIPASPRGSTVPRGLEDGRLLPLPPNVWFVGTANHDETTKDFADKTFDRAHVMELPRRHPAFQGSKKYPRSAIALAALEDAFDDAVEAFYGEAQRAYRTIDDRLAPPLGDDFEVGWGFRLKRQWDAFVPVVRAAGGTLGEAVDQLVASKLLRPLRDRHDLQAEALKRLRDAVGATLKAVDGAWFAPGKSRSLAAIRRELVRLGAEGPG